MINLMAMVRNGDLTNNILLKPNDVIYVQPNPLAALGEGIQMVLFPVRPAMDAASVPYTNNTLGRLWRAVWPLSQPVRRRGGLRAKCCAWWPARRGLFFVTVCLAASAALVGSQLLPMRYTGTTIFERRVDAAAQDLLPNRSDSFATQKFTLQNELIGHPAWPRRSRNCTWFRRCRRAPAEEAQASQVQAQAVETHFMENLKIASRVSPEQVDTVSLTFTWPDPAMCEKLPNYLVQRYFDSVSEQIKTRLKQSCDFLSQRVDEAKKGLQEAAGRRMKYQADHAQQYPEPGSFQRG